MGRSQMFGEVLRHRVRSFGTGENGKTAGPRMFDQVFGTNRFGMQELKQALPLNVFQQFLDNLRKGTQVSEETANTIAEAVKSWALIKGATHYCHWFQPQTGATAEKHDSLFRENDEGLPIAEFTKIQLIQGEPDASSFPSGGMRSTFEARGYTAWDPTSPMFIIENENGKTLCIPSVFISYTGEALDKKTPLLRSMKAVDVSARSLLDVLSNSHGVNGVTPVAGPEQEFFLVDKSFYCRRPDLVLTHRVLGGLPSTRGQYLEDHYFGSIPPRVQAFMQEVEYELYKIGIVARTRHNEVGPSQFEFAVLHQDANVAADQNQMVMVTMNRVAERHDFKLLLHEKPFSDVNGSGKHVNWSLRTDTGINLLSPGKTSFENLRFLSFLASLLKGIHLYGGLIRASVGSLGNDRRLGGNEAPPGIVSVFLGETISEIVRQIKAKNFCKIGLAKNLIALGVKSIPSIEKDDTDRNRTSPFAFTGNKFEFRAVGSSASISFPVTVINTVVAEGMSLFADAVKKNLRKERNRDLAVLCALHEFFCETEAVVFDGNNYSHEWVKEATSRKLRNYKTSLEAFEELRSQPVKDLFERKGVLFQREIESRFNVRSESYLKLFVIECRTLIDLVFQCVIPAAEAQIRIHDQAIVGMSRLSKTATGPLVERAKLLVLDMNKLIKDTLVLKKHVGDDGSQKSLDGQIQWVTQTGLVLQNKIENQIGVIESQVAHHLWGLPKVFEMLHVR